CCSRRNSGTDRTLKGSPFFHKVHRPVCRGPDRSAASPFFQQELDTRHDKYERLVKISRDITIESKRSIFLLHRVTNIPDPEVVLNEAESKLDGVRQKIGQIAEELRGEDIYQFHRAFTPGELLQTV
uniref:Uncharacterized protein n=1 Tax=Poecilia mexicana TaxID=48701 RepID=A0A3B3Z4G3_9TELE